MLRNSLWFVPAVEIVAVTLLFVVTYEIDQAADSGSLTLPAWVNSGSADAARQILIGVAAAVITVVGLVFSILIVVLTLASTQFGPRMLRTFIRDRGVQITLGTFVATFFYAVLTLGSVSHGEDGHFVPHLSITVCLALTLVDVADPRVLHPSRCEVDSASRSHRRDRARPVERDRDPVLGAPVTYEAHSPPRVLYQARSRRNGAPVVATRTGYLQFVRYSTLVEIAVECDAVIELLHRPGHFVARGLPLVRVRPPSAAEEVSRGLEKAHVVGAHRTLRQDLSFAIDQLVEIAIRASSPAVNDTFTAMTCIDWLSDGLRQITGAWHSRRVHFDHVGKVRVIAAETSYERFVDRAFDKIRQAGRAMPAVMIRQPDVLGEDHERDVHSRAARACS